VKPLWLAAGAFALLSGCAALTKMPVPEGFVPFAGDARVWVEPGHEAYGARVAAALPAAIAQVEAAHYLPFVRPPRVYVCGSAACFARWVKTPKVSAAVVPDNRLILSPRLDDPERDRLPALLAHELAHLHLGQRIGHYHSTVPVWFHEGWASLTAGGGGAEYASDVQVFEAIRAGRRVDLIVRDAPDKRHRAPASRLDVHGFYRQSMLLVGWLRTQDPVRFRQLVLAIQDNADFEIAFWQAYGQSPASRLAGFFGGVLGDNGDTQAAPAAPISVP
jgi:hypothetical protein